jgi:glycosyltransferase involved in cell wall biosynthesis
MDKLADKVVFISEYGMKYYLEHFAVSDRNKYLLSYIGTPKQKLAPDQKQKCFRIVSCSYVVPLKRLDIIIRALASIDDMAVEWVHIGDGSAMSGVQSMAEEMLAPKNNISYRLMGYMDHRAVLQMYGKEYFDVFILISDTEGLPFSIMEAFSFGIPVIANDVGGVKEMIDSGNGKLLPAGPDPVLLAEAIREMASLPEEQREEQRKNAIDTWKEKFSSEINAEKFARQLLRLE